MELSNTDKCIKWQQDRGLDVLPFVIEEAMYRYLEEICEMRGFGSEEAKTLARKLTTFIEVKAIEDNIKEPTPDVVIDAIDDLWVFGVGDSLKLGYDPEGTKSETLKEISSRKGAWSEEKGKWIKDPNQDKSTLYTADYSKCKIK